MTLVILAAGMGSRYGGLKQIDPMTENGEFIIDFSVYDAVKAGFDKVVFVIKKENYEAFHETIGKRIAKYIHVDYAFQELSDIPAGFTVPEGRTKPWGTTHALLAARDLVKDNFAVINSDDYYGRDTIEKLAVHLHDAKTENGVIPACMVGFRLGNTLTDNGTVSRGDCQVSESGELTNIVERTKIKANGAMAAYLADDGETWVDLPYDTIVSMNCWGFTPEVFGYLEKSLKKFLASPAGSQPKSECYLPGTVAEMIGDGTCRVKVYSTASVWHGVTYTEDKPLVKEAIRQMIEDGTYPNKLWN